MPRVARETSSSGRYLIMIRGINPQDIFEDDHDIQRYIRNTRSVQKANYF